MMKKTESLPVVMYTDLLRDIGYISYEFWDRWTLQYGNLVDVGIPRTILRRWYDTHIKQKYEGMSFWKWYCEESLAEDMDGFFNYTEWRPFLVDILDWGAGPSHYAILKGEEAA